MHNKTQKSIRNKGTTVPEGWILQLEDRATQLQDQFGEWPGFQRLVQNAKKARGAVINEARRGCVVISQNNCLARCMAVAFITVAIEAFNEK